MAVKIYDAGGDTGKRWYVYYTDATGKMVKIYKGINCTHDAEKRRKACADIVLAISKGKFIRSTRVVYCINTIAAKYLSEKKLSLKRKSYFSDKTAVMRYVEYCSQCNCATRTTTAKDIVNYSLYLLRSGVCNRTVNDYIRTLSTFFAWQINNRHCAENPVKGFKYYVERSQRNTPFTEVQFRAVFAWAAIHDKKLFIYLKFMAYMLMRPSELLSVKISDIDFTTYSFWLKAGNVKNNQAIFKKIPEIIQPFFDVYKNMPGNYYLFGYAGDPGNIPCGQNYFGNRFRYMLKCLQFPPGYNMYGIKHTVASNLVLNGVKDYELMQLTGHRDIQSINAYIKSIGAMPPIDTSDRISLFK